MLSRSGLMMEHLRTLRWARSCLIPDTSLMSIGCLGTRQWLNNEAMAILVYMLNIHLSEKKSCMLSCLRSNFIWHAWQSFQSDGVWLRRNWISRLYNKFKGRSLEWLGLAVNVMVGGGPHKQENHWIGIVIDALKSTIYIAHSQQNLPDKQVIDMLQWFLKGASQSDSGDTEVQSLQEFSDPESGGEGASLSSGSISSGFSGGEGHNKSAGSTSSSSSESRSGDKSQK